jgi:GAF domain-containing protein
MTTPRPIDGGPTIEAQRLHRLLDAHRFITADLALLPMLERIVTAACDLVGAAYGALGVLGPDGSLELVVRRGSEAESPAEPPMRSGLTVPIRVRGAAFGELFLADPEPGRFEDPAEDLVTALAASAGTAIENARLFDQAKGSRDWLNAAAAVARALLADADEGALLDVVSQALDLAEADYGALILPTDAGELRVTVAQGLGAEEFRGRTFDPDTSPLGRAIIGGESCRTTDFVDWGDPGFTNRYGYGPAMLAPLVDLHGIRGAVLLIRRCGRLPFQTDDVQQATTFAAQVALALELNDARADAEWLRVVEERHRIAQDLHDNVMQRLFAIGLGLEGVVSQQAEAGAAERLRRHIADLDQTIEQIRAAVFGLRTGAPPLRHQRGRYPHVGSPTPGGAPGPEERAKTAAVRTLGRPTTNDQDR